MSEINGENQIVIRGKGQKAGIFDFNSYYRGYYPFCKFTAVAERGRCIYAAGTDEGGNPHLFLSVDGAAWEERVIVSRFHLTKASAYGRIQNILPAPDSELVFLVTENGYLVILPDCPKCVRALQLSEIPIGEGWISGNKICLRDIHGKVIQYFRDVAMWYRCAWTYAAPHLGKDGVLLDLRGKESRQEIPIPGAIPFEEDYLDIFLTEAPKESYLFFVCERGMKADDAVSLARARGYEKAYSLGGVGDILLDMDKK